MTRLINPDDIPYAVNVDHPSGEYDYAYRCEIDAMPTVDAVPVVHGRWDKGTDSYWHICEECGAEVDISMGTGVWVEGVELHELKYCPNCGARMDAERKEHEQID